MRKIIALAAIVPTIITMAEADESEVHTVTPAMAAVCIRTTEPIELDGILDDAAWERGIAFSGFTFSQSQKQMPYNQTSATIVRDDAAIYIGVRCLEEHMDGLIAAETGLDAKVWHDDDIELFFDPAHTHREFLQFAANTRPARFDGNTGVATWDSDWQVAATTGDDGWNLEFRIPFQAIGYSPGIGEIWGFNICRERQAAGDTQLHNWANVKGNFHRPRLFGHLYFAGNEFELTQDIAHGLLQHIDVPVRICLRDGFAVIDDSGVHRRKYRALLAAAVGKAGNLASSHRRLEKKYRDNPDLPHRDRFHAIDNRYKKLRNAAGADTELSPLNWARYTVQIRRLKSDLHSLLWKVKLTLLLKNA